MERFDSLLYIGAGVDVQTLTQIPFVRKFILIDGLPMCEYGDPEPLLYMPHTPDTWYSETFIQKLFDQMGARLFKFVRTDTFDRHWKSASNEKLYSNDIDKYPFSYPTLIQFEHPCEKYIDYYASAPFGPGNVPEVQRAAEQAEAVLIKGHVPDQTLITYCQRPKTWFLHVSCRGTGIYQEPHSVLSVIWRMPDLDYRRVVKQAFEITDAGKITEIADIRYYLL